MRTVRCLNKAPDGSSGGRRLLTRATVVIECLKKHDSDAPNCENEVTRGHSSQRPVCRSVPYLDTMSRRFLIAASCYRDAGRRVFLICQAERPERSRGPGLLSFSSRGAPSVRE